MLRTAKYVPLWTFVPRALYAQFCRVANLYFLLISILQIFTNLSPTGKLTTVLPLAGVVGLSMLREALEDYQRHKVDRRVNSRKTHVLRDGAFVVCRWRDLRVGDVVRVSCDEEFPADLVVLSTAREEGLCYAETSNLDGETNLKMRQAASPGTQAWQTPQALQSARGYVEFEVPSPSIYMFRGALVPLAPSQPPVPSNEWYRAFGKVHLQASHVVLRGARLCHTRYLHGVVIYTGGDTKIARNSVATRSKRSNVEGVVNRCILVIFCALLAMCTASVVVENATYISFYAPRLTREVVSAATAAIQLAAAIAAHGYANTTADGTSNSSGGGGGAMQHYVNGSVIVPYAIPQELLDGDAPLEGTPSVANGDYGGTWYLPYVYEHGAAAFSTPSYTSWVTFLLLYNTLWPISLYVALEFCKLVQARMMEQDQLLYHEPSGTRFQARTSTLNEDLGQVRYVFTDKTGTLTQNQMLFHCCAIGDVVYVPKPPDAPAVAGAAGDCGGADGGESESVLGKADQGEGGMSSPAPTAECADGALTPPSAPTTRASVGGGSPVPQGRASWTPPSLAQLSSGTRPSRADLLPTGSSPPRHEILATAEAARDATPPPGALGSRRGSAGAASEGAETYFEDYDGESFRERRYWQDLATDLDAPDVLDFCLTMALCHEVVPWVHADGSVTYQAASPDEGALVAAARHIGVAFVGRSSKALQYKVDDVAHELELLAINPFSSDRKRMSILTRHPDGRYVLYCKGADEVLLPLLGGRSAEAKRVPARAKQEQARAQERAKIQLSSFASQGLRTLVLAKTCLAEEDVNAWLSKYETAISSSAPSSNERAEQLAELAAEIEVDLTLVGISGIEDRLQEGVPQTVERLQQADIRVWMLTGDKHETAVSVARSAGLLHDFTSVVSLHGTSLKATRKMLAARYAEVVQWRMRQSLNASRHGHGSTRRELAVVVDGAALAHCVDDKELRALFLSIVLDCTTIVACRVSPRQKAEVVRMVQCSASPGPLTLAIGDGANDVSMLQEAHVGVGVAGNEGMQAVQASDYAVAQFAHLGRLLLVHGVWCYDRVCTVALYMVYKQLVLNGTLFFFNMYNGMSGTSLYDSVMIISYSMLYTFVPVLTVGCLDQPVRASTAFDYPQAYYHGQANRGFSLRIVCAWAGDAVLHSAIIFFVTLGAWSAAGGVEGGEVTVLPDGRDGSLLVLGTCLNIMVVLVTNLKLALTMHMHAAPQLVALVSCVLLWFVVELLWDLSQPLLHGTMGVTTDVAYYGCFTATMSSPVFWLSLPLVSLGALLVDVARKADATASHPSLMDALRTVDHALQREEDAATGAKACSRRQRKFKSAMVVPASVAGRPDSPPPRDGGSPSSVGCVAGFAEPRRTRMRMTSDFNDDAVSPCAYRYGSSSSMSPPKEESGPPSPHAAAAAPTRLLQEAKRLAAATSSRYAHLLRAMRSAQQQRAAAYKSKAAAGGTGGAEGDELLKRNDVVTSWWWLRFSSDAALERTFCTMYSRQTLIRTRFVLLGCILLVLGGAGVSTATYVMDSGRGSRSATDFVLLYLAAAVMVVIWVVIRRVTYVQNRLHELIAVVGVFSSIGTKLMLSKGGFYSFHGFPMVFSFVLRLRFTLAFPLVLFDLVMYLSFWGMRTVGIVPSDIVPAWSEVVLILFVWCLMTGMCLSGARTSERAVRHDFLLQLELRASRQMAQSMLNNMLPEHIVGKLESTTGMVLASEEPLVSVLFCEIVDFHSIVAQLSAVELVTLLDRTWSKFDLLSEKHGVTKMETVGATYMAVGGLHLNTCQPVEVTRMAFECCELASKIYHGEEMTPLQVRIGLHCGPVLSGVVGTKKPQFSLFGDTVNTAARMQSTGEAMGVQMSEAIYNEWLAATEETPSEREGLEWETREVKAKGKGTMATYFATKLRKPPPVAVDSPGSFTASRSPSIGRRVPLAGCPVIGGKLMSASSRNNRPSITRGRTMLGVDRTVRSDAPMPSASTFQARNGLAASRRTDPTGNERIDRRSDPGPVDGSSREASFPGVRDGAMAVDRRSDPPPTSVLRKSQTASVLLRATPFDLPPPVVVGESSTAGRHARSADDGPDEMDLRRPSAKDGGPSETPSDTAESAATSAAGDLAGCDGSRPSRVSKVCSDSALYGAEYRCGKEAPPVTADDRGGTRSLEEQSSMSATALGPEAEAPGTAVAPTPARSRPRFSKEVPHPSSTPDSPLVPPSEGGSESPSTPPAAPRRAAACNTALSPASRARGLDAARYTEKEGGRNLRIKSPSPTPSPEGSERKQSTIGGRKNSTLARVRAGSTALMVSKFYATLTQQRASARHSDAGPSGRGDAARSELSGEHLKAPTLLRRPSVAMPAGCAPERTGKKRVSPLYGGTDSPTGSGRKSSDSHYGSGGRSFHSSRSGMIYERGSTQSRHSELERSPSFSASPGKRFSKFYQRTSCALFDRTSDEEDRRTDLDAERNGRMGAGRFAQPPPGARRSSDNSITSCTSSVNGRLGSAASVAVTAVEEESVQLRPITLRFRDHAASSGDQTTTMLTTVMASHSTQGHHAREPRLHKPRLSVISLSSMGSALASSSSRLVSAQASLQGSRRHSSSSASGRDSDGRAPASRRCASASVAVMPPSCEDSADAPGPTTVDGADGRTDGGTSGASTSNKRFSHRSSSTGTLPLRNSIECNKVAAPVTAPAEDGGAGATDGGGGCRRTSADMAAPSQAESIAAAAERAAAAIAATGDGGDTAIGAARVGATPEPCCASLSALGPPERPAPLLPQTSSLGRPNRAFRRLSAVGAHESVRLARHCRVTSFAPSDGRATPHATEHAPAAPHEAASAPSGQAKAIDFSKGVSGAYLEQRFHAFTLPQRLINNRFGLGVTAAVMFAVALVDVYRALSVLGAPHCAPLCLPHARLPLVLVEMGASACCLLALLLTHHPHCTRLALRVVVLAYVLVGVAIALASAAFDRIFAIRLSTSLMILFYALVGNVSGLRFLHVLLVCALGLGAYGTRIALHFGWISEDHRTFWHWLVTYDAPLDGHPRPMLPHSEQLEQVDLLELLLWMGLAIFGSLSSSYSQESYERRRFVLVQRLKHETERVDAFLYRMLPPMVVAQMKRGFHVADEFDDVFILASDICGFTKLSAASQPSEVMQLLSQLFSKFDEISEAMGVYKVQTIGDAYIAVSGIFSSSGDDQDDDLMTTSETRTRRRRQNAKRIVEFAVTMVETIKTVRLPPGVPGPLNMRIGIHVGHLTAGVIGMKRLRYDIWGSAFLAATALESNGVPGEVCVSEEVMRQLDTVYDFERHQSVKLKAALKDGSTEVTSYKLNRARAPPPAAAAT